jgi:hypothetical protein
VDHVEKGIEEMQQSPSESYLIFSEMRDNKKLNELLPVIYRAGYDGRTLIVNLPSGPMNSCPFAKDCAASPVPLDAEGNQLRRQDWREAKSWKIVNGPDQKFRCYAASLEVIFKGLRDNTHHNLDLLQAARKAGGRHGMAALIERSLKRAGAWDTKSVLRLHSSGEFFTAGYLDAWIDVAQRTPSNRYYAYTKAVGWAVARRDRIPSNLAITVSRGGTQDELISRFNMKESIVVGSEEEAAALGLKVDHDDSHALFGTESFALVIHGAGNAKLKGTSIQPTIELIAAD